MGSEMCIRDRNNPAPTFLFNKIKILKSSISNDKHIFSILKSHIGFSMKSVAFNAIDTQVGEYLLNYKKDIKVVGQINQNFWNNKKTLQLIIKDLVL